MFCEVVIKIDILEKMSEFGLTGGKSKISKKLVKLLQNGLKMCYNAYTIKNRKG